MSVAFGYFELEPTKIGPLAQNVLYGFGFFRTVQTPESMMLSAHTFNVAMGKGLRF